MKELKSLSLLIILLFVACSAPQNQSNLSDEISADDIAEYITFLASEELNGREAGTADEAKAANYIADLFRDFGLEPAGDDQTFFQEFTINTSILNNPHSTDTTGEKDFLKM